MGLFEDFEVWIELLQWAWLTEDLDLSNEKLVLLSGDIIFVTEKRN